MKKQPNPWELGATLYMPATRKDIAEVVLEVALHVRGVRPRPAQEGGRLKGPPAGAEGKVLGVQHDAGKQCLGLLPKDLGGLAEVL